MPFTRLSYGSHGSRIIFSSTLASNPAGQNAKEKTVFNLAPSPDRRLKGIRIRTLYNFPGLPQAFLIYFNPNPMLTTLPIPVAISAQTADNIGAGILVNLDATLTPERFIPLSEKDCQECTIYNVSDPNNVCQAIFDFELE